MPKLSYKERERQRREQEILRAAARLIRERGYANLSMDEIADEVGVSKPTLYQHFKSKDEMIASTMIHSIEIMETHMDSLEGQPPLEQLEKILRHLLETHSAPNGFPTTIVPDQVLRALETHERVIEYRKRVGEHLYKLILQGQAQGQITPSISPVVVVGGMFSMLAVLRGPRVMGEQGVTPAEVSEGIVRLFLHGITP